MHGAPYTNPQMPPPVTGRSFTKIGLTLLSLLVLAGGVFLAVLYFQGTKAAASVGEKAVQTSKPQSVYPPLEEKPVAQAAPPVEDPNVKRWAEQQRINQALLVALEELKKRKPATATAVRQPAQETKPPPHAAPLYIANKIEAQPAASPVPEYTLAPWATRIPCTIEPLMNSDVPGAFTAKVSTNVYDTKTGRHLLVPQGATLGGHDRGETLIYGNERLPTVALALTIADRTYDLGNAPVTDQLGTNGLTGDVDQHYGRLLAAVLIQGVLKAGTVAITEAAGGTVVSGFTSAGNQATSKVTAPMLNTRPTIKVFSGQGCAVLLVKELKLPAQWQ